MVANSWSYAHVPPEHNYQLSATLNTILKSIFLLTSLNHMLKMGEETLGKTQD